MKEVIISFEVAKLAKEKGFNAPTLFFYFKNFQAGLDYILINQFGETQFGKIENVDNHNKEGYYINRYSAPSQSLLQKWLREEYGLFVLVTDVVKSNLPERKEKLNWYCEIYNVDDFNIRIKNDKNAFYFDTYEAALEAGLSQALKLIKDEEMEKSPNGH